MADPVEGITFGVSIIALDAQGKAATSARDADSLFATWFCSNLSTQHAEILTFPGGILFNLKIVGSTQDYWSSTPPAASADYSVILNPGDHFAIPINPPPVGVPQQFPSIPLAQICKDNAIPPSTDLSVLVAIPLKSGPQITQAMLSRTPGTEMRHNDQRKEVRRQSERKTDEK